MPEPLQAGELKALRLVAEFASMAIESKRQVEEPMMQAAVALGCQKPFQVLLDSDSHHPYIKDQAQLRSWLDALMKWRRVQAKQREAVLQQVATWAGYAHPYLQTSVENGRIRRRVLIHPNGVQAVVGDALARVLSEDARRAGLIGKCPNCSSYFIKPRSDAKACSTRCRVALFRAKGK